MKSHLSQLLSSAVQTLKSQGDLPEDLSVETGLERTRDRKHGDFASNLAMVLCKLARRGAFACHEAGGTYYRAFASDGETIYMVVDDPARPG